MPQLVFRLKEYSDSKLQGIRSTSILHTHVHTVRVQWNVNSKYEPAYECYTANAVLGPNDAADKDKMVAAYGQVIMTFECRFFTN